MHFEREFDVHRSLSEITALLDDDATIESLLPGTTVTLRTVESIMFMPELSLAARCSSRVFRYR